MAERKLASIQRILDIQPIDGADKIEIVKVLGWQVVVQKGDFKPGDLCVYFEVDSLLPINPEYEFLRKSCYKKMEDGSEGFRLKTIRLRKQLSQGLCIPTSIIPESNHFFIIGLDEGTDVTEILGVKKWEPPLPAELRGMVEGMRPFWVPKTDEIRIQSEPDLLEEFKGKFCYMSLKINGTSSSFGNNGKEINVCSRKLVMKQIEENKDNTYIRIYNKYSLETILKDAGNFCIQGEIAGPGIQGNPLMLKEHQLFVFNIWNTEELKYLGFVDFSTFCSKYNLPTVPILRENIVFDFTMEQLLEMAEGVYKGTNNPIEGIVIRPMIETYSNVLKGRLSCKVLNNTQLLQEE